MEGDGIHTNINGDSDNNQTSSDSSVNIADNTQNTNNMDDSANGSGEQLAVSLSGLAADASGANNIDPNLKGDEALKKAGQEMLIDNLKYEDIIKKDVLDLMGFKDLPEDKKQSFLRRIEETIQNRVAARIFDALNEADRNKYDELMDKPQEAHDFLISRDIDPVKWLAEETLVMKLELYEDGRLVKAKAKEVQANRNQKDINSQGEDGHQ